jgi:hypothetical protein
MRTYKHWLLIDGMQRQYSIIKQWNSLKEYQEKYPESKITVYNKEYGSIFDKVICLETIQKYNDLDLDCNSLFDGSLKRLCRKPANLETTGEFEKLYQIYTRESA